MRLCRESAGTWNCKWDAIELIWIVIGLIPVVDDSSLPKHTFF